MESDGVEARAGRRSRRESKAEVELTTYSRGKRCRQVRSIERDNGRRSCRGCGHRAEGGCSIYSPIYPKLYLNGVGRIGVLYQQIHLNQRLSNIGEAAMPLGKVNGS